jgi:hypothetical protein
MAKPTFPTALDMRALKYGKDIPAADKDRWAKALRDAGRRAEAILLYDGRTDSPALKEDLDWAVREGAAFYLFSLQRMGLAVEADRFRACAEAAEAKERWYDARRCWEALKDEAGLARIAPHLPGYIAPPPPGAEPLPGTTATSA